MKLWIRSKLDSTVTFVEIHGERITVGSDRQNDIVLRSPLVPELAIVIARSGGSWFVQRAADTDCTLEGALFPPEESVPLAHRSRIDIYPFQLEVDDAVPTVPADTQSPIDAQMAALVNEVHITLLKQMDASDHRDDRKNNPAFLVALEHQIQKIVETLLPRQQEPAQLINHLVGVSVRQAVCNELSRLAQQSRAAEAESEASTAELSLKSGETTGGPTTADLSQQHPWQELHSKIPDLELDRRQLEHYVMNQLRMDEVSDLSAKLDLVESEFGNCWPAIADQLVTDFKRYLAVGEVIKQIKDSLFGFGPLQDLLLMPHVSEIMVVRCDRIYVERNGVIENSGRRFVNDEVTVQIIQRIVQGVNRRIDRSQPLVDARLADGSRVNAVIPPLAVSGPCLTIRKFPERLTMAALIKKGSLSHAVAQFLRAAVHQRRNIIVSGGTGTGKTTLLNCLSEYIPDKERIVTVEDTAELSLSKRHVIQLEARCANAADKGAYTIRDLVRNALRMRPDRIVIGECRGPEALDMLQAMNTGHDGSLTTLHANNPRDAALRLETLVSSGSDLPILSIRRQIASAIDLIIQVARDSRGKRRVWQISEVVGLTPDTGEISMKDLFVTVVHGGHPRLSPTGYLPSFMEALIESGALQLDAFYDQGKPARTNAQRTDPPLRSHGRPSAAAAAVRRRVRT